MTGENEKAPEKDVGRLRYLGTRQTALAGILLPAAALLILLFGIAVFLRGAEAAAWYVLAASAGLAVFLLAAALFAGGSFYGFVRFQKSGIKVYLPFRKPFYLFYRDVKHAGAARTALGQKTVREKRETVWIYLSTAPVRPHVLRHITELPNGKGSLRFPRCGELETLLESELPGDAGAALKRELQRIDKETRGRT